MKIADLDSDTIWSQRPLRNAVLKVFFDRHGKAERVVMLVSSGNKERDALCIEFAQRSSIPIPRLGTKLAGQLWRQIVIKKEAVFSVQALSQSKCNEAQK